MIGESLDLDDVPPNTGSQYGSVEPHVFSNPQRARHWQEIYEKAGYECRHRLDPSFQWSAKGEVLLKRKVIPKSLSYGLLV